jgi:hypothetical protein
MEDHHISSVNIHEDVENLGRSLSSISEETVLRVFGTILDTTNLPVLICCDSGRHHTGKRPNQCSALVSLASGLRHAIVIFCRHDRWLLEKASTLEPDKHI